MFQIHEMLPGDHEYENVRFIEQRDNIIDAQEIVDVLNKTAINWEVYCIILKPVFE